MNLDTLLRKLEVEGIANDEKQEDKSKKYLNITRDTGEFLSVLITMTSASNILEVGTSNGYSTLWIASSLPDSGKVRTLEVNSDKISAAKANFELSGLSEKIFVDQRNANEYFRTANDSYDLIFLDADRKQYLSFAEEVVNSLSKGGVLVCDNAVSHAQELVPFVRYIEQTNRFRSCTIPVGKGEFLACKVD